MYTTMRPTNHSIVSAACAAAVLVTPVGPADAQQVEAGTLECRGGPDTGFILGPVTNLDCVLHVDSAPDRRYVAAIRNLDAFIGDQDVSVTWKVMASVPWLGRDDIAGVYTHADGAGVNVLIGGSNAPITLRPPNEQDAPSPSVKIENLELRPVDP
ncbi:DUF992 domain-containing protein [Bradyrhizobium uaiense]|nr:DUF992 domain-containing protein [Bradyrhizobium uaiense]